MNNNPSEQIEQAIHKLKHQRAELEAKIQNDEEEKSELANKIKELEDKTELLKQSILDSQQKLELLANTIVETENGYSKIVTATNTLMDIVMKSMDSHKISVNNDKIDFE